MPDPLFDQTDRWLTLSSALGDGKLLPTEMAGREEISRPFAFEITALSPDTSIAPGDILGKDATLTIKRPGSDAARIVNGIVTQIDGGAFTRNGHRYYHLTLSPKLWLLDRRSDHFVYHDTTVVTATEAVLQRNGITFSKKLSGSYASKEYRVQYGETDLAFISRILADEGIFYYFTHSSGGHEMVLCDHADYPAATIKDAIYRQDDPDATNAIFQFRLRRQLTDPAWTHGHYDFEAPNSSLSAKKPTVVASSSSLPESQYVFGAGEPKQEALAQRSKQRIEEAEAGFETLDGSGTCTAFLPGHSFTFKADGDAPLPEAADYVVTSLEHWVSDPAYFNQAGGQATADYRNSFKAIPTARTARDMAPPRKPIVNGAQSALVVGPAGEEIHTDKYGRVRVQFPWDRVGEKNEKSSCFVRVAQSWASKQWGTMFIPRIGMEVVVHFTDGDPDLPIITGTVYNGVNMPPWTLPDQMTVSGFKTRSTKTGTAENANELSFDDKKGSELVLFHAEKDFKREVENDDTLDVGHDQTRTVKNNRTTTISEGNDALTISKGNRTETISEGNETLTISKGNRSDTISQGNDTLAIAAGNRSVTLDQGNDSLKLGAGNLEITLDTGNASLKCSTGKITLDATAGITLQCGSNKIEITPQGITVQGMMVAVKGETKTDIEGLMVNVKASAVAQVNGAMVKIN